MSRIPLIAVLLLLSFGATSCAEDSPSLVDTSWKGLEIEYCLPSGVTRVVSITDPVELESLRASVQPGAPTGLTMLITSYTNEVRLRLDSGQDWNIYYRDSAKKVTFYDPNSIKRSFVVGVSDKLYARISEILIAQGGSRISLASDCRIPKMADK